MKIRKAISLVLVLATALGAFLAFDALAADSTDVLSPAIFVIAAKNSMAKSAMKGQELLFDKSDFARALNVAKVGGITVTDVPATGEGKLLLGSTVVNAGSSIDASNLSLLSFRADSDSVSRSSFCFSPEGESYKLVCNIYMLDKANYAPTVSAVSPEALNVSTYENITHYGKLLAHDPDGDEVIFEIVSYPKEGLLVMSDSTSGEYVYTPADNYTGKDSFTYVAKDKYGNYSPACTVKLEVDRLSISTVYEDMSASRYHASALAMTEEGIMSGTLVGDGYYFYPENTVSRAEFVVMAMKARGVSAAEGAVQTIFADDAEIDPLMKGYIAAAQKLGYVNGTQRDGKTCFLPNEPISRAEAAVIVGRMINATSPTVTPVFSDSEEIPAWAQSAVLSLSSMGYLMSENGEIQPTAALTREQTAGILCGVLKNN